MKTSKKSWPRIDLIPAGFRRVCRRLQAENASLCWSITTLMLEIVFEEEALPTQSNNLTCRITQAQCHLHDCTNSGGYATQLRMPVLQRRQNHTSKTPSGGLQPLETLKKHYVKKVDFQMMLLWAFSSKNNVKTELSSQNYVDPAYFQLKISNIFGLHMTSKKALHRPAVRPAVLEYPPTYNKRQPKGCNKTPTGGYNL